MVIRLLECFETQQFSTLAQVTSQRYTREQLSMVRPSAGGVPVFSIYCQRLIELMVDVRRASRAATEGHDDLAFLNLR